MIDCDRSVPASSCGSFCLQRAGGLLSRLRMDGFLSLFAPKFVLDKTSDISKLITQRLGNLSMLSCFNCFMKSFHHLIKSTLTTATFRVATSFTFKTFSHHETPEVTFIICFVVGCWENRRKFALIFSIDNCFREVAISKSNNLI